MEYEKIEKVYEGTYLDYYNVTYRNCTTIPPTRW